MTHARHEPDDDRTDDDRTDDGRTDACADGTDAPLDAGTGPDESKPVLDAEPDERFDAG